MQTSSHILLIRPVAFSFNHETSLTNAFQQATPLEPAKLLHLVQSEFDAMVAKLRTKKVNLLQIDDTAEPAKPDAVFPNNWISTHADGTLVLYPMCTPNRRNERRVDIVEKLQQGFKVSKKIDLSAHEQENIFLEGTGSIVFDHQHKRAYACLSPRTNGALLNTLAHQLGYTAIAFHAYDESKQEIYHTNVMMCIGSRFAVVCLESITDLNERKHVSNTLKADGLELIEITFAQMQQFCGNMLELKNREGKTLLALSNSAFTALTSQQKQQISKFAEFVPLSIPTIETVGGGSVRCMIAEIFLTPRVS